MWPVYSDSLAASEEGKQSSHLLMSALRGGAEDLTTRLIPSFG
jgi:hypothetical protein